MMSPLNQTEVDTGESVHWNKVMKLLILSSLSAIGTIGNIFAISAIMLENQLKKRGNIFIVNLAIADFIVSAFAIPASSIIILAGAKDSLDVCSFQWFSAMLCCHVSVLSLMFIAVENRCRLSWTVASYDRYFSKTNIVISVFLAWIVSTVCVTLQFVLHLSPNYCTMNFQGVFLYHAIVGSVLVAFPMLVAFFCYVSAVLRASKEVQSPTGSGGATAAKEGATSPQPPEGKTMTMVARHDDYALLKTNFLVFFVFPFFWLPLGIAVGVGDSQDIARQTYDNLSWLALSNSCINSFIYGLSNKHFRSAYINLFHYCCCKTSVSFNSRRPRADLSRPHSDVRVHIIPGYNMYAPPRQQPKVVPKMKSKDVYEL